MQEDLDKAKGLKQELGQLTSEHTQSLQTLQLVCHPWDTSG